MQTAALFDLDGVIVDTEGQYTKFWEGIGEEFFPEQSDFARRIKGHTLVQILDQYFPENPDVQRAVQERLARFEQQMDYPYVDGAVSFVRALRTAGVKTAVVTSSNAEKMQCLYRCHPELPELFDEIFTAEHARRSKPAPDCYLAAAAHFGLDARDCCVFEDSISGLQAGRDSGACVVGLTTTNSAEAVAPYCQHVMAGFTGFGVEEMYQLIKR